METLSPIIPISSLFSTLSLSAICQNPITGGNKKKDYATHLQVNVAFFISYASYK